MLVNLTKCYTAVLASVGIASASAGQLDRRRLLQLKISGRHGNRVQSGLVTVWVDDLTKILGDRLKTLSGAASS